MPKERGSAAASLVLVGLLVSAAQLGAQERLPTPSPQRTLGPSSPKGLPVAPLFEGWFENPDGTYSVAFGYFNMNTEEVVHIPIGDDNFIEPEEFNGGQSTHFTVEPRRETGTFTVTLPRDWDSSRDVVWTLRWNGQSLAVPGRIGNPAYKLRTGPMAAGSRPPSLRFEENGPRHMGIPGTEAGDKFGGIKAGPYTVKVGEPLTLSVWALDEHTNLVPGTLGEEIPRVVNVHWFRHQGPGDVEFEPKSIEPIEDPSGKATTTATFSVPGEYVLRVRADNFASPDSSPQDQCCWTNGFVHVTVTP